jgi:hypothetical protein
LTAIPNSLVHNRTVAACIPGNKAPISKAEISSSTRKPHPLYFMRNFMSLAIFIKCVIIYAVIVRFLQISMLVFHAGFYLEGVS